MDNFASFRAFKTNILENTIPLSTVSKTQKIEIPGIWCPQSLRSPLPGWAAGCRSPPWGTPGPPRTASSPGVRAPGRTRTGGSWRWRCRGGACQPKIRKGSKRGKKQLVLKLSIDLGHEYVLLHSASISWFACLETICGKLRSIESASEKKALKKRARTWSHWKVTFCANGMASDSPSKVLVALSPSASSDRMGGQSAYSQDGAVPFHSPAEVQSSEGEPVSS